MKEMLKQLKQLASHSLRADEKDQMRREFRAHLDTNPLPHQHADLLPSRYTLYIAAIRRTASYATLGLVVAGSFTVSASEFSLPNDPLYAIKTGVTERTILAGTSLSPTLHARASNAMLTRRLKEAQTLMLQEEFEAQTADKVQAAITAQTTEINRSINRMATTNGSEDVAAVRDELATTLSTYAPLLDIIALRQSAPDTTAVDTSIEEVIAKHLKAAPKEMTAAEMQQIKHNIITHYAEVLLDELEAQNKRIRSDIAAAPQATTVVTKEIATRLADANAARDTAEAALADDDPETALEAIRVALSIAQEAHTRIVEEVATMTTSPTESTADETVSAGTTGEAATTIDSSATSTSEAADPVKTAN